MIGRVDPSGRALLEITLRTGATSQALEVWIDTGFSGDLVLPQFVVDDWQLQQSGSVDAILADGTQIELRTYSCAIDWFGKVRLLEIIANDGDVPLLGVGLLLGKELRVDYRNLKLSLLPVE